MKQYSNTFFTAFLMLTLFFSSCAEKRLDGMVKDRIYLMNPGLRTVPVFDWGKDSVGLQVFKSGVGQQPAKVALAIDPALISKYNPGAAYELMDERFYKVVHDVLEFKEGDYKRSFDLVLDVDALKQAVAAGKKYALPCKVTIVEGTVQPAKDAVLEQVLLFDIKSPYLFFEASGVIQNPINVAAGAGNAFWFYTKVHANYPSDGSIAFEVMVDEAYVREYNRVNGTNLIPMPATAVAFNTGQWTIPAHGNMRQLDCRILKDKLVKSDGQPAYGEYWMPLLIKSASKNGIDPKKNMQIFRVLYTDSK